MMLGVFRFWMGNRPRRVTSLYLKAGLPGRYLNYKDMYGSVQDTHVQDPLGLTEKSISCPMFLCVFAG